MLISFLSLIFAIILVVLSAKFFLSAAIKIGEMLSISPYLTGMVILGFGTSIPELVSAVMTSLDGQPNIAIGTALGSNIINITLILGIIAVFFKVPVQKHISKIELPVLFMALVLTFWLFYSDNVFSYQDSLILLSVLVLAVILFNYLASRRGDNIRKAIPKKYNKREILFSAIKITIGLVALVGSSQYLSSIAVDIAKLTTLSDLSIGLTILATSTSFPEFAVILVAASKGRQKEAFGVIVGSNLFDTLLILAFVGNIGISAIADGLLEALFPIIMGIYAMTLIFAIGITSRRSEISRWQGFILLGVFTGYMVFSVNV